MDRFAVAEGRMLYFHRLLHDQAERSPVLWERARARLDRKASSPVGERWRQLLDGPHDALADAVLADTPDGGVLRSHSPLLDALSEDERNALWQRVGLQQFVAYAFAACSDLALSEDETMAALGATPEMMADWRSEAPLTLTGDRLEPLKQIVAIGRALQTLYPDAADRRAWMRAPLAAFSAAPVTVIVNGGTEMLRQYLVETVKPRLGAADLPSH